MYTAATARLLGPGVYVTGSAPKNGCRHVDDGVSEVEIKIVTVTKMPFFLGGRKSNERERESTSTEAGGNAVGMCQHTNTPTRILLVAAGFFCVFQRINTKSVLVRTALKESRLGLVVDGNVGAEPA